MRGIISDFNLSGRDIADIIIIAFIIYLAIQLLRETHSISVFAGVLSIVVFYGISLFFDLPMTHFVFKSIIGIFAIFVVVIFQKELRRFFTSFGSFTPMRKKFFPSEAVINTVSRSAFEMARRKMGAIIVFSGREPAERYLEGGFILNGAVSEPLILSIFDESSPGHDGALFIEGNRIKKFAVHLPLAEQFSIVKEFGLRHRAALGLSERTDALVIVVSQEKAAVHIFRNGEFSRIANENELKEKIFGFLREKFASIGKINLYKIIRESAAVFAISFAIALLIWIFIELRVIFNF